jgi:hypothetical protein
VKKIALFMCAFVLLPAATFGGQEKPLPPGRKELKNYQITHPDEPPAVTKPQRDPLQLQKEAAELASLAQSIPPAVDNVSKGLLPKDVLEKLKRIEKISKHMRAELEP